MTLLTLTKLMTIIELLEMNVSLKTYKEKIPMNVKSTTDYRLQTTDSKLPSTN